MKIKIQDFKGINFCVMVMEMLQMWLTLCSLLFSPCFEMRYSIALREKSL